jgi:hypothetical protein
LAVEVPSPRARLSAVVLLAWRTPIGSVRAPLVVIASVSGSSSARKPPEVPHDSQVRLERFQ